MLPDMEEVRVAHLTDLEREAILELLQRDHQLRQQVVEKGWRRPDAEMLVVGKRGGQRCCQHGCGCCPEPQGPLASAPRPHCGCRPPVCPNCCSVGPDTSRLGKFCAKWTDSKTVTEDKKVGHFLRAPENIFRTSLRERPVLRKSETTREQHREKVRGRSATRPAPADPVRADGLNSSTPDLETSAQLSRVCCPKPCSRDSLLDDGSFQKIPRKASKSSEHLRGGGADVLGGPMGDRSRSAPGLNTQDEEDNLAGLRRKAAHTSAHNLCCFNTKDAPVCDDASGEIVFSLSYDQHSRALCVLIKECHNLAYGDTARRRSNPYVKCYLLPDKSSQSKRKTTKKPNTVNPVYNEALKYPISQSQLLMRTLQLSVWHHNGLGRNTFLGAADLPLDCRDLQSALEERLPLRGKKAPPTASSTFAQHKGGLVISLKFVPTGNQEEGGELHVLVREARNLMVKEGGELDSLVTGCLLSSTAEIVKTLSTEAKSSSNPHYDHTFVYEDLSLEKLRIMCLELTVLDCETKPSGNVFGVVRLNSGPGTFGGTEWGDSTEMEVCLWQKMMQYPGSWTEGDLAMRGTVDK